MELIVVRHGRTAWNAQRRFQGHSDVPLDEEGRAQARALASRLRDERFDYAVCSDLARARETAEIILAGRETQPVADAGWREMRFGGWEGLTWPEITAGYPEPDLDEKSRPLHIPQGGESFEELCVRVKAAVNRLTAVVPPLGRAFAVTHAGPLHALLRVLTGMSEDECMRAHLPPGSIARFVQSNTDWKGNVR
jgi:broad specificity phosphatase PhoE